MPDLVAEFLQIENPGDHQVVKVTHLTNGGPAWKSGQIFFSLFLIEFSLNLNLFFLAFAGQINVGDIINSVNSTNVAGKKTHEIEQLICNGPGMTGDRPACVFELQRSIRWTAKPNLADQCIEPEHSVPIPPFSGEDDKMNPPLGILLCKGSGIWFDPHKC